MTSDLRCDRYYAIDCCIFQAEDGIRDLVRSRGLGDVYKRQALGRDAGELGPVERLGQLDGFVGEHGSPVLQVDPVSYTHLTLPTSDLG